MAFIEAQFPPQYSWGAVSGPVFNTSVSETTAGYEQRVKNWSLPRRRYDVSHNVKPEVDFRVLRNFFLAVEGRFNSFRLKDWTDYSSEGKQDCSPATGDGMNKTFQLMKTYTSVAGTKTRTIKKPVSGSVRVYVNSVEQLSGWSVNTTTGVITFGVAPTNGHTVKAEYEFDTPARLESDEMAASIMSSGIYDWPNIVLIEERL